MGAVARYTGAALLALLGVGFFPFSMLALASSGGQLLAGCSVVLLFLAYRLWPSHSKAPQNPQQPKRVLPQGWPVKDEARVLQPSLPEQRPVADPGMPATPNMPDITKSEPVGVFMLGGRCVMFHKEPPTIAARSGVDLPLTYFFTGTVYEVSTRKTLVVYTLESIVSGDVCFCAFDQAGTRTNIGDGTLLNDLSTFEAAVLERACKAAGVPRDAARRIDA